MRPADIRINEQAGQHESIVLALLAIAEAGGMTLDYDDLCAAMGLSFTAVSTTAEPSPGWWLTFGRDVFVEPVGERFGFRLRNLHPPDVGVDMLGADEFPQHFEISYKPLICRALENDQPVLAWQGWADDRWPHWGVITAVQSDALLGVTLGGEEGLVPLTNPAMQCYVVEAYEPTEVPRDQLFALAMASADGYMNRGVLNPTVDDVRKPRVVTGPAGFDAWEHWLTTEIENDDAWYEHVHHAQRVCASRKSARRFLKKSLEFLSPKQRETVIDAIDCCDDLLTHLETSCDDEVVQDAFAAKHGRDPLLEAVHAAEGADRRLAIRIEELHAATR